MSDSNKRLVVEVELSAEAAAKLEQATAIEAMRVLYRAIAEIKKHPVLWTQEMQDTRGEGSSSSVGTVWWLHKVDESAGENGLVLIDDVPVVPIQERGITIDMFMRGRDAYVEQYGDTVDGHTDAAYIRTLEKIIYENVGLDAFQRGGYDQEVHNRIVAKFEVNSE